MGLFGEFRGASRQRERLLQLKFDLLDAGEWTRLVKSPLYGSGIRIGFAVVDCRSCGKTDAGLLLDQTLWDLQTHKVSYANCLSDSSTWTAEFQGPQRQTAKDTWLSSAWRSFNEDSGQARETLGRKVLSSRKFDSLEKWIITDFMEQGHLLKVKMAETIRQNASDDIVNHMNDCIRREKLKL